MPMTFLSISSKPGSARNEFSAARSAGCSQEREEIAVSLTVSAILEPRRLETGDWRQDSHPYVLAGAQVSSACCHFLTFRACRLALRQTVEGLLEVGNQVLHLLDSAGKANQPVRDPKLDPHVGRDRGMRQCRGVADERFDP